jgi:hypothetical protein
VSNDDGVEGNERLTGLTGALLLLPLAVEGVTIIRIGQMIWLHMFVGMLLFGLIGLKLGSTGYRFFGYYTGREAYVRKGPPVTPLRLLAIPVVLSTVAVMVTGVLLLLEGPGSRDQLLLLHKVSFIVWVAFTAIHVLAHLVDSYNSVQSDYGVLATGTPRVSRRGARLLLIGAALLAGVIIAAIAIPDYSAWQHAMALRHHGG